MFLYVKIVKDYMKSRKKRLPALRNFCENLLLSTQRGYIRPGTGIADFTILMEHLEDGNYQMMAKYIENNKMVPGEINDKKINDVKRASEYLTDFLDFCYEKKYLVKNENYKKQSPA